MLQRLANGEVVVDLKWLRFKRSTAVYDVAWNVRFPIVGSKSDVLISFEARTNPRDLDPLNPTLGPSESSMKTRNKPRTPPRVPCLWDDGQPHQAPALVSFPIRRSHIRA